MLFSRLLTGCKNKMSINRISKPLDGAEVKLKIRLLEVPRIVANMQEFYRFDICFKNQS